MNRPNLTCLQNIVLDGFYPQADALYVNKTVQEACVSYDTCTYMNIFSFNIWKENTTAEKFYLYLKYSGAGAITIHFSDADLSIRQSMNIELPASNVGSLVPISVSSFPYAYIAWEERTDFKLVSAAWLADCTVPRQDVRLAICIPTYKRRDDICSTLALYEHVVNTQSDFAAVTHLYVHNNDPDEDLSGLSSCPQVTIINSNANIGGAGAFNRCAQLAVEKGYSHVLFMDDDALPHEEAWLRTLALLQHLKPEKQEHFIAGNCLTREAPLFCHAVREAIDERGRIMCHQIGQLRLTEQEQLTAALSACISHTVGEDTHPYAAWWYCAIPCTAFHRYGWPEERFFCFGDDIEFSLACKAKIICCNGVSVWHPSFDRPMNPQRRYFAVRNFYTLRKKHFGNKFLVKNLFSNLYKLVCNRKFKNAEVTARAFYDFLIGKFSKPEYITIMKYGSFLSLIYIIKFSVKILFLGARNEKN